MNNENNPVDINLASSEALESVPGIGPALAARILAARPYDSLEDLTRVSGIGPMLLDRLRPYLSVTTPSDQVFEMPAVGTVSELQDRPPEEPTDVMGDLEPEGSEPVSTLPEVVQNSQETKTPEEEGEPLPEILKSDLPAGSENAAAAEPSGKPPASAFTGVASGQTKPVQRSEVLWIGVALSILVLALSLVFTLGTLSLVNGTLNYASAADLRALNTRAEALATRLQVLESDVEILQSRLNTFEALGGRITTLERANETLRSDLSAASEEIDQLREQTAQFSNQIEELRSRNNIFQNFLDGLRGLLNSTVTP